MVLASFAGAAATATAADHHHNPAVITPTGVASVTTGARVNIPLTGTTTGTTPTTSVAVPSIVISDPLGTIVTGSTVTVALVAPVGAAQATRILTGTPAIAATGTGVTALNPTLNGAGTTVTFTVNVNTANAGTAATFTLTGLSFQGATRTGAVAFTATGTSPATGTPVDFGPLTTSVGAVTRTLAAASGASAADTAAVLFRSAFPTVTTPTNLVVATDSVPQDAESAAYLAKTLGTGVLLTNPVSLSSAVRTIISQYTNIANVYIVGGTSVVSAADASAIAGVRAGITVTRYSGATQYDTNASVLSSAPTTTQTTVALPYSQTSAPTPYNTSGGASSNATSTPAPPAGAGTTVILASGEIGSYQDALGAGPLSYANAIPLVLTTPTALSSTAKLEIQRIAPAQVIVLGGPLAVSNAVVGSITGTLASGGLNTPVFRVGGQDATDTAQLFADVEVLPNATAGTNPVTHSVAGLAFNHTDGGGILLARGNGFQDALAAAPYAGGATVKTPILLTENASDLGIYLRSYLVTNGNLATDGTTINGPASYSIQPIGGALSLPATTLKAATDATVAGVKP